MTFREPIVRVTLPSRTVTGRVKSKMDGVDVGTRRRSSTHTERVEVDANRGKLTFKIETSSYPNWEATEQVRNYSFDDGTLTYSVPASASGNGTVAYSIWRRARS